MAAAQRLWEGFSGVGHWGDRLCDPDTGQDVGYIMWDSDPTGKQMTSVFCHLCGKGRRGHRTVGADMPRTTAR